MNKEPIRFHKLGNPETRLQQTESSPILDGRLHLGRVLERRGFGPEAINYIRTWVHFPGLLLTPTQSMFKVTFLNQFMAEFGGKRKNCRKTDETARRNGIS